MGALLRCYWLGDRFPEGVGRARMTERPCSISSSPLSRASKFHTGPAWRTFTLSRPLQPGIRLLCRLRPLASALAFSYPAEAGQAGESSPVPSPVHSSPRSCVLYAGRTSEQPALETGANASAAFPFWVGCVSHFHPLYLTTFQTQVPRVSIGCKTSPVIRLVVHRSRCIVSGLRTPTSATRRRTPPDLHAVTQA